MKVSLFITCFNDTLFPETGRAVVHLLERLGYTVDFPQDQTCCGQMHYNTGYQREALPLIRYFVHIFGSSEVVVAPSASCVGMVREIYPLAARWFDDHQLVADVAALAPRVYELTEFLHMIQRASQRLEVLTARLLELAKLEAGALQIEYRPVDGPALARGAIAFAQRLVPEPLLDRFTFQLQCRDEAGNQAQEVPAVRGDALHLRKVLEYLLENAIRFSPEGGRIDVIVQLAPHGRTSSDADQPITTSVFLEICVCDFGLSILPEELERIFDRFYRVDTRLTRERNSLGLGLTLCKYLVALHGGHIWAESCPAGSSAFHLWLPLEASPSML